MKTLVIILLLVIIVLGAAYVTLANCAEDWCLVFESQKVKLVNNFESCAALGFPIMESYPRQCRAGDKTYTEEIAAQPVQTEKIRITTPLPNMVIGNPLVIKGEARGNWYFEASFPVRLLDGNGKEIAVIPAQAKGEWMTTDFVPFEVSLPFTRPTTTTGTLVLEKDNPSGLPEHDEKVTIPVRFQ